jgi:hypothetical protein
MELSDIQFYFITVLPIIAFCFAIAFALASFVVLHAYGSYLCFEKSFLLGMISLFFSPLAMVVGICDLANKDILN